MGTLVLTLALVGCFFALLWAFYKMGERNGEQTLQISEAETKEETIARAISAGKSASDKFKRLHDSK